MIRVSPAFRALAVATALSLASAAARALDVGDAAPAFELPKWLVGDAVNPGKPDGQSVYLVEFWKIPSPACEQSTRKLNKLHKEYGPQGLKVVAVNAEDEQTTLDRLKLNPIEYASGLDPRGVAFKPYMDDDGREEAPYAFLVGKDGNILWMGVSLEDELERVIRGALDGGYTLEKARNIASVRKALEEAAQLRDPEAMVAALKKLMDVDPQNVNWPVNLYQIAGQIGRPDEQKAALEHWKAGFDDDANAQARLAMALVMAPNLPDRDPVFAAAAARKALALDAAGKEFATLIAGQALMEIGLLDDAAKALANWKPEDADIDRQMKPLVADLLAYMEKLKQAREVR